jgi:error-prone DNA polymerase
VTYVELHAHSTFSLLDGASAPESLIAQAHALGMPALALTDHDDLGGAVRFATAARELGVGGIIGAEVSFVPPGADRPTSLVLLAESREGYGNICTLITRARCDHPRGQPRITLEQLAAHSTGVFALSGAAHGWVPALLHNGDGTAALNAAATLRDVFGGRFAIEVWDHLMPGERTLVKQLVPLAKALGVPWVVANHVHYAEARERLVHDTLVTLRYGGTLDTMGTRLKPNAEWHLKGYAAMAEHWGHDSPGLRASVRIAERCAFRMADMRPSLPVFALPPGVTADEYLRALVERGADERWGTTRTPKHEAQLEHELTLIGKLGLAGYFLIVWDIVRFARREGILCQGRGSAANSAVCYVLGITAVDPIKLNLLFARFLSEERAEAPDIDIDFAHRERERVLQYVYDKYGRDHAAMVCEHITWRGRSAVRDGARVLGFTPQQGDALAQWADRWSAKLTAAALRGEGVAEPLAPEIQVTKGPANYNKELEAKLIGQNLTRGTEATTMLRAVREETRAGYTAAVRAAPKPAPAPSSLSQAGLDPRDPRAAQLADIVEGLHQAPRHRGIHVGGFVLTREPLYTVVPIEPASMADRTVIQWEKDDLDPAGLVKIDLLGLGMLTVVQDCLKYIRRTRGVTIDLGQLDCADQAVYDDLCRADTVGVFQVESRAQMNTLPRLKPRCFYDLVVEVALIRPGPIQGDMVHPYLRRRAGTEEVTYPHPTLEPILKRTLGVPLFQEQGMQVAIAAAGFTPGEADLLRKAMGHKRSRERMADICQKMIEGMERNGIPADVAMRIYNQINAFADYGFPESHAASFALIVYASAYLRHYYAPEFLAAILNAQPMGFYSPASLIEDAQRHGVRVRPVNLARSAWDHTLVRGPDGTPAVRLGVRLVQGLGAKARGILERALAQGPFTSIDDVLTRAPLPVDALRSLAEGGAFDVFVRDEPKERRRRVALWRVLERVRGSGGPLVVYDDAPVPAAVPAYSAPELTAADYRATGVSLNGHPLKHLRSLLLPNGIVTAATVRTMQDGERIAVAGLVICRQRPGTAKGFVFLTLEDETGMINVVVKPQLFEQQAVLISRTPVLLVRGVLQVESGVWNIRAKSFTGLPGVEGTEGVRGRNYH